MAKTYTAVPNVSTLQTYASSDYNTYTATNVNNLIVRAVARARRSASQNFANSVVAAVNFDTQDIDTDDMFAPTDRVVTIKTAGIYIVTAHVSVSANATGNRTMIIHQNPTFSGSGDTSTITGGTVIAKSAHTQTSATEAATAASTIYEFAVNDTIGVGIFQNSGGTLGTEGSSTSLSVAWIGRTS